MKIIHRDYIKTGLELELELGDLNIPSRIITNLAYWIAEIDGSLRNNGIELKLIRPLYNKEINYALKELTHVFREARITPLNYRNIVSDRTGFHIHLDVVENIDYPQVFNVLLGFVLMERFMFSATEESRTFSPFTQKINKTSILTDLIDYKLDLIRNIKKIKTHYKKYTQEQIRQEIKHSIRSRLLVFSHGWPKYSSITLQPYRDLGTIEVRLMSNYPHPSYIKNWITLCQGIYKYFGEKDLSSNKEINNIFNEIQQPFRFLSSIIQDNMCHSYFTRKYNNDPKLLKSILEESIQHIYCTIEERKKGNSQDNRVSTAPDPNDVRVEEVNPPEDHIVQEFRPSTTEEAERALHRERRRIQEIQNSTNFRFVTYTAQTGTNN